MFRITIALVLLLAVVAGGSPSLVAQEASPSAASKTAPPAVNINTATSAQLEELPGIGPKTAQRIVDYRQKNGPFKKVEDLMQVNGIGEKSFLKLKPLVSIGAAKAEKATPPSQ
jgi:competence protein ComEA